MRAYGVKSYGHIRNDNYRHGARRCGICAARARGYAKGAKARARRAGKADSRQD